MRPLALVGNLSRDRVEGGPPRIGGAPFYGAAALRVLGRPAHVLAKCGDEDRRSFQRALTALGAHVTLLRAPETTAFSFEYDGDARRMFVDAVGESWTVGQVADVPPGAWVHVAPLLRDDFDAATVEAIARRRRVLLDGQGLVRRRAEGPLVVDGDFDRALLRHVAVLKLAEDEAELLAPIDELGVPEIVVTLGRRGCIVHANGAATTIAARAVAAHVDPTGAGDAFAAAYLAARSDGHVPTSAARRATAVVAALLSRRRR